MNLGSKVHKNEIPSVAYVPQEAWIFGGTIRKVFEFGSFLLVVSNNISDSLISLVGGFSTATR